MSAVSPCQKTHAHDNNNKNSTCTSGAKPTSWLDSREAGQTCQQKHLAFERNILIAQSKKINATYGRWRHREEPTSIYVLRLMRVTSSLGTGLFVTKLERTTWAECQTVSGVSS